VEHQDLETVLAQLKADDYDLEPRLMLEVRVIRADRDVADVTVVALNEAAIVRGAHARVMHVVVDVGDSRVATYVCDGIVVASPTGSTGYSFSAGGPIIEPTSRNLVVTPIAAYLTPLRSSVVGPQHVVSVRVEAAHDAQVSIDGREDIRLDIGDRVEVRAREKPIAFIQPRGALPFWDLLRQKASLLPA
jgi:NAD+ kinase